MNPAVTKGRWRLSLLLAILYAVQGSFWALLAVHLADLGISGRARGWIFATLAIGSAAVPLGMGQLVDRLMTADRLLVVAYGLGSLLLLAAALGWVTSATGIFLLFVGVWSLMGPGYSVSGTLVMRNLRDPAGEYGRVRLWGTIGWMAGGWIASALIVWLGVAQVGAGAYPAIGLAAACAAATSLYSLTLPRTPPLAVGARQAGAFAESLALARNRDVAVFLVTSFGVYLTVPVMFQVMPGFLEARGLPRAWTSTVMTLGQIGEVAALAILPFLIRRLGIKGVLVLGIGCWFIRFLMLALGPPLWLAVAGTVLHGPGIACFTVGGQIFIDSRASQHLRASAQALLLVCTSGVGAFLGNVGAGEIANHLDPNDVLVFLIPCVIDGALLVYFLRGFWAPVSGKNWAGASAVDHAPSLESSRGPVARGGRLLAESADG